MICIPSKSDKEASQLRDCLRILAWQQYKIENQVKGLEAYEEFANEWKNHEVQKMNLKALEKLIKELGYSINEITNIRSEYYQNKQQINIQENVNQEQNLDEIPY